MSESHRSSGGRRPDRGKDALILTAARDSFVDRGFAGSTIEEIALQAGVSKVTVYKRFGDKEALFETAVRAEMATMVAQLDHEPGVDGPLAQHLNAFGYVLLQFLFSPAHVALDRMLAFDLARRPDLARRFFDAGPGHCRTRIVAVLDAAADRGEIAIDDPLLAAADLLSLWRGFLEQESKLGVIKGISDVDLRFRVERGTRNFLRMTAPAGHRAPMLQA